MTFEEHNKAVEFSYNFYDAFIDFEPYFDKCDTLFSEWYRREKDGFHSSTWYTYEVEKYIDDLIYEFKIPFKI